MLVRYTVITPTSTTNGRCCDRVAGAGPKGSPGIADPGSRSSRRSNPGHPAVTHWKRL